MAGLDKLKFSPSGDRLFHITPDSVRVWSLEQAPIAYQVSGSLVGISSNHTTFLTQDGQGVQAWAIATGQEVALADIDPQDYAPGNRCTIRYNVMALTVDIRDALTGRMTSFGLMPPDGITSLDGVILGRHGLAAAFYFDNGAHDAAWGTYHELNGVQRFKFNLNRFTTIPYLEVCDAHNLLVAETQQGTYTLYDLSSGKALRRIPFPVPLGRVFAHVAHQAVIVRTGPYQFQIRRGKKVQEITEGLIVVDAQFHPAQPQVASLLQDGTIRLYDMESGELLLNLNSSF